MEPGTKTPDKFIKTTRENLDRRLKLKLTILSFVISFFILTAGFFVVTQSPEDGDRPAVNPAPGTKEKRCGGDDEQLFEHLTFLAYGAMLGGFLGLLYVFIRRTFKTIWQSSSELTLTSPSDAATPIQTEPKKETGKDPLEEFCKLHNTYHCYDLV